jgi:hypothetical protein
MMKWLLIIALYDPRAGTLVQVKVPMADEATCIAAMSELRVTRRGGKTIDWLDALCEPRP